MKEEFYMPIWIKASLAFLLVMIGIDKKHPYSLFAACLVLFVIALAMIRWVHIG